MTANYRQKANRVLGWVFVAFAAAAAAQHFYPHQLIVQILYTVTEAALVGGLADWFAVAALFRRPLGFPWHTALIPSNRDKMIQTIAAAVQNELLSKESIKRRLAGTRIVDLAISWLESRDRQVVFHQTIPGIARDLLAGFAPNTLANYGQRMLKKYLGERPLAGKVRQLLDWGLDSGEIDRLLDYILSQLRAAVERDSTRLAIQRYLERVKESVSQTWWQRLIVDIAELTDTLNMAEAAAVLHGELRQFLLDISDREHSIRRWIRARLSTAGEKLGTDPDWQRSVLDWQQGLAARLDLEAALTTLVELALESIPPDRAASWIGQQAEKLWDTFRADGNLQDWVEERLKVAVGEFIDIEHNLVATVVKEALQRLDDEDLNRFIEDKAGEDLAWIRINGSVVGGLVGLMLFLLLHYIYDPYVVPIVRSLLL